MLELRTSSWWYIAGALAVLLYVVVCVAYFYPLQAWYVRNTIAPQIERDLGFEARSVQTNPRFTERTLVITSVAPTGPSVRAGLRVGDRPFDFHGHSEISFYENLEHSRGSTALVRVSRLDPNADIPRLLEVRVFVPKR